MKRKLALFLLVFLFLTGCISLFYPDYESPRVIKFLITSQILFALSIAIYYAARPFDFESRHKQLFFILIALAITARIIMLIGADNKYYLSDDIYRYIWDGKVNAHGINPYIYPPTAPELVNLRENDIYPHINHRHLPTIYPPMAQNIFLVTYILGGENTFVFKLIAALFELLTIMALLIWLRKLGIKRNNILLYLFSPLVLIEFYMSAHVDILAMPFLVAALVALKDKRPILLGILLALSGLIKFPSLFIAPVIFFYLNNKDRWLFGLTLVGTIVLLYIPYIINSNGSFMGSLMQYLDAWQFNGSIYNVLKYGLGLSWARYAVAGAFILWLIYIIMRKQTIENKFYQTYGGWLVLTPTFFPWYYIWIFPMVLKNLSPAFLYLSGVVLLSYHVHIGYYSTGEWSPMPWLGIMYYLPFYLLLILSVVRGRFKGSQ